MTELPELLSWDEFLAEMRRFAPELPEDVRPDTELDGSGPLNHVQRTALRLAVTQLRGDLDPRAVRACRHLGELFELVRRADHDSTRSDPVRGVYRTENVFLRPIEQSDIPHLYRAAMDPNEGYRWRFRGRTLSLPEFSKALFSGILAQFAVCASKDGRLIGLVTAYDEWAGAGHAKLAFQRVADVDVGTGGMIEGMGLFIDYLFNTFSLRKLYSEMPAYNEFLMAGIEGLIKTEGRFTSYIYHRDQYWDLIVLSISKEDWTAFVDSMLGPEGP